MGRRRSLGAFVIFRQVERSRRRHIEQCGMDTKLARSAENFSIQLNFGQGLPFCRHSGAADDRQRGPKSNWRSCRERCCSSKTIRARSSGRQSRRDRPAPRARRAKARSIPVEHSSVHFLALFAKIGEAKAPFPRPASCSRRSWTRTSFDSSRENMSGTRKNTFWNSTAP